MEMIGQLAAAQLALESAIADLSRSGSDPAILAASRAQLSSLNSMLQRVSLAGGSALASLRAEAIAVSASASTLAEQAVESASAGGGSSSMTRAQAARQAIEEVGNDLFERHALDPYLKFSSAEDEEEYRKREQERAEERERALALHTPEGDRQAYEITRDQWRDAGEHGADKSPEYRAFGDRLDQAERDLSGPEARATVQHSSAKAPTNDGKTSSSANDGMDDIAAALRAAGVQTIESAKADGHGLAAAARTTAGQGTQLG